MLPPILSNLLTTFHRPTLQQYNLIKSFSLLLLGMFLSSLATLNFSLAMIIGLLSAPLSFVKPFPNSAAARAVCFALLNAISPAAVLLAGAAYWKLSVTTILTEAAVAWHVSGTYSSVLVWCVWWPAWLAGCVTVLGRPGDKEEEKNKTKKA